MPNFLDKKLESLYQHDAHGWGGHEVSGYDPCLAHIGLDSSEARFHPIVFKTPRRLLDEGIDAIYAAAQSGNRWADFLIHEAAANQIDNAPQQAIAACEGGFTVTDDEIAEYESDYRFQVRENQPIPNPFDAILELDKSLLIIELIIERNGLQPE